MERGIKVEVWSFVEDPWGIKTLKEKKGKKTSRRVSCLCKSKKNHFKEIKKIQISPYLDHNLFTENSNGMLRI